jgi:protein-S-isoprenylcysteine O-methyltransferase Ste14
VPTRRTTWLPLAAVVSNGLLAGACLDQSIKQLPARHRIGVTVVAADFVLQPGVVASLVPWWLTGWQLRQPFRGWAPPRMARVALLTASTLVLVHAFARFVVKGLGTPAPHRPDPAAGRRRPLPVCPQPMYLAVTAVIVGQALALGQPGLLLYAAAVGGATAAFAHGYEEPVLTRQFGARYEAYRRAVPAWWPRHRPWQPDQANQPARHQP